MRNVAIYVEGYHDRAFLQGWLLHRGWKDPRPRRTGRVKNPVTTNLVVGGRFGFQSADDSSFVEVSPLHGDGRVLLALEDLARRKSPPDPDELVVVLDIDGTDLAQGASRRAQSVHDRLVRSGVEVTREGPSWRLASGVLVHLALWSCEGPGGEGVPNAHTLERIVSTALARSYPDRAAAVQAWLDGRPAPPNHGAKEHSWSYMAGWYADKGCDAFLSTLWEDPRLAAELERVLSESGVEAIIRRFE